MNRHPTKTGTSPVNGHDGTSCNKPETAQQDERVRQALDELYAQRLVLWRQPVQTMSCALAGIGRGIDEWYSGFRSRRIFVFLLILLPQLYFFASNTRFASYLEPKPDVKEKMHFFQSILSVSWKVGGGEHAFYGVVGPNVARLTTRLENERHLVGCSGDHGTFVEAIMVSLVEGILWAIATTLGKLPLFLLASQAFAKPKSLKKYNTNQIIVDLAAYVTLPLLASLPIGCYELVLLGAAYSQVSLSVFAVGTCLGKLTYACTQVILIVFAFGSDMDRREFLLSVRELPAGVGQFIYGLLNDYFRQLKDTFLPEKDFVYDANPPRSIVELYTLTVVCLAIPISLCFIINRIAQSHYKRSRSEHACGNHCKEE